MKIFHLKKKKKISVGALVLCLAGWIGWGIALFLPAVESEVGKKYAMPGIECLLMSLPIWVVVIPPLPFLLMPFFLANVATLSSPFVFIRKNRGQVPIWLQYSWCLATLNLIYLPVVWHGKLYAGAFVWLVSNLAISLGLWIQYRFHRAVIW